MKKILFIISVITLASCQKNVYLTGSLMHQLQENELDLTRIQFYNDNPLYLEREVPSSDANIKSGKVVFKNGRYINRIALEKNTPGIVQTENNGHLMIAFEKSNEESSLRFGPVAGEKGEYFYQLVDNNGSPMFSRIDYEGSKYLVIYKKPRVRIMLSRSVFTNMKVKVRRMKGNKIKSQYK
ncbi:hypothetical protein VB776_02700 [Arcicella sp. DC2W]|uniref:DUF4251 domain-containing protein n=1 Tax=Arcicella gelida TaxID=2984195 RepID=A0ABU5S0H7_9BACT|nr:hypothetical protein [Arcicella sp. DC2W]MEA5401808.1 hypothetical protein [Arcicella sp. DC2W]